MSFQVVKKRNGERVCQTEGECERERESKHVFAELVNWGSWKRGGVQNGGGKKKREKRGNAGAMLMEGTKGPTPQSKRAVTDHVMKLPPLPVKSGRDRERVRDAK